MANRRNAIYLLLIVFLLWGLFSGRTMFFSLSYLLFILLGGAFIWSWMSVNWVGISRQTPAQRAQVGKHFEERFVVTNKGIFPKLWLEVRDQSSLPGHKASHVVPTMLPRRRYGWGVNTRCERRGVFTLGPLNINSGDPFGLFQFPRHIKATTRVIVYPATVPLHEFASPIGRLSGGQAVRRRTYEVTTNAAGIRDYAPGDSLNRIHWKTSARRGKLYVKEFELDPLSDVWVFVDFDRSVYVNAAGAGERTQAGGGWRLPSNTEEYSVTCAASISEYYIDKGRAVGMVCYTPFRQIVQPDRGDRQLSDILETLALAKSETNMTISQMLAVDSGLVGRGNTLIVITTSLDQAWVREAENLKRRGLHLIAVMIDPTSFGAYHESDFMEVRATAEDVGIYTYPIKLYDDLTEALSFNPVIRAGR